jgi:hypothetical protein
MILWELGGGPEQVLTPPDLGGDEDEENEHCDPCRYNLPMASRPASSPSRAR